jgi:dCTP deaminase
MILSAQSIVGRNLLEPMHARTRLHGSTYGLGPAGYDLRLVLPELEGEKPDVWDLRPGDFLLAAAEEHFTMPNDILGIVHDKSSFARRGMSVFNTVIEPGWRGWLTLELVNLGREPIKLFAGQGIAQVIFHQLDRPTEPYEGKYQDQEWGPQAARCD